MGFELTILKDTGCSPAVKHMPRDREVVGLKPAGTGFFLLFSILSVERP